ncbi:MAG: acyltransferase family protein [Clostridia bacterium]|nr:acyltransferase family protein [Clostridia bacterium]
MLDRLRKNLHIDFVRCLIALPAAFLSSLSVSVFCYVRSFPEMGLYYSGGMTNLLGNAVTVWTILLFLPMAVFFAAVLHAVRKPHITGAVVSLLLAFNMVVSLSMEHSELTEIFLPDGVMCNALTLLGFALLLDACVELLYLWCDRRTQRRILLQRMDAWTVFKQFLTAMFVVLLCWLPIILCCYPGSMHNDTRYQVMGWIGLKQITASHPILTTAVYGSLYQLGMYIGGQNEALFLNVVFQALFNAAAIGLVAVYNRKYTGSRGWYWATVLFFGLLPVWQSASQLIIKDVLHTGCYLLFYVVYLECLRTREKKWSHVLLLLFTAILVAYTRKAAFYLALICIIVVTVAHWKKFFLPYLVMLMMFAGLFWFSQQVLYPMVGIGEEWKSENYSLQFQQVALYCRTYGDEMTDEEKAIINGTLDFDTIVRDYSPMKSDDVKSTFHDTWKDHAEFWALYRQMFLRHPLLFVKGTIMTTFEHMNPWFDGINFRVAISHEEDFITVEFASGMHRELSKFWNLCLRIPVIRMLIGNGLYTWLLLAALGYSLKKRSLWAFLGLIPSLTLFIGLFMSHVNGEIRYGYPLIAATPLVFCWVLYASSQGRGKGSFTEESAAEPPRRSLADRLRHAAARLDQASETMDVILHGQKATNAQAVASPSQAAEKPESAPASPQAEDAGQKNKDVPATPVPSTEEAAQPQEGAPGNSHTEKRKMPSLWSRLLFAYSEDGRIEADGVMFRAGAAAILSALSVSLLGYLNTQGDITGIRYLLLNAFNIRFFLLLIPFFLLYSVLYRMIGKVYFSSLAVSGVMAMSVVVSLAMNHSGFSEIFLPAGAAGNLVILLGIALMIHACVSLIYVWFDRKSARRIKPIRVSGSSLPQEYGGAFFSIFICWIPILFFCYPGSVDTSAASQVGQWIGQDGMTNAYPLLSTAFYGLICQLNRIVGSEEKAWMLCVLLQGILNAAVMACTAVSVGRLAGSKTWKWVTVAFFGILPAWQNAAQLVMPEVFQTGILLLFCCQYLKCLDKEHRVRDIVGLLVCALLVMFAKTNAVIIVGICFAILLLRHWKKRLLHYIVCLAITAGVFWGGSQFLYPMLNIQPAAEDHTREFQQAALYCRTYQEEMTEDEIAVVAGALDDDTFLPEYTTLNADADKAGVPAESGAGENADMTAFWQLYQQMREKHPLLFVKERIMGTFGYWDPWFSQVNLRLSIAQKPGVVSTRFASDSRVRMVRDYWEAWLHAPVARMLVGTGLFVWLLLTALGYSVKRRSLPAFLGLAPSLVLLAELCISPANGDLRYSYALIAATPLILSWVVYAASQKAAVQAEETAGMSLRQWAEGIPDRLEKAAERNKIHPRSAAETPAAPVQPETEKKGPVAGPAVPQQETTKPAWTAPPPETHAKPQPAPAAVPADQAAEQTKTPLPDAPVPSDAKTPENGTELHAEQGGLDKVLSWIQTYIPIPRNPKVYLDVVKIIAIYMVLFNHTGSSGFTMYRKVTELPWHLPLVVLSIFIKIAVPLFFMASGALLLGRDEPYKALFKHRVLRFSIILVAASFINYWAYVKGNSPFSLLDFLSRLYTNDVVTPLWYLYSYIAFLCMLPFLRKLARQMKDTDYLWLLLSFLLMKLISVADAMLYQGSNYHASDFYLFTAYTYVVYALCGYYIEKDGLKKYDSGMFFVLLMASLASLGLTYLLTEWKAAAAGGWENTEAQDFFNTLIVIPSITVFYGCKLYFEKRPVPKNTKRILSLISTCTFGTYLFERTWRFSVSDLEYRLRPFLGELGASMARILAACAVGILATFAWKIVSGFVKKKAGNVAERITSLKDKKS